MSQDVNSKFVIGFYFCIKDMIHSGIYKTKQKIELLEIAFI